VKRKGRENPIIDIRKVDNNTIDYRLPIDSSNPACYYQSNHSKIEAIPFSALPKDTTSELAGLSPH